MTEASYLNASDNKNAFLQRTSFEIKHELANEVFLSFYVRCQDSSEWMTFDDMKGIITRQTFDQICPQAKQVGRIFFLEVTPTTV